MPKKRNRSTGSGTGTTPRTNWNKVKSGGSAFRSVSVPVNTRSRKLNNKTY